jgi:histidyl-tRNA synthetase
MTTLGPVRGTYDIFPPESHKFRHIFNSFFSTAQLFGFEEIQTPILEFSQVFKRAVGDTSDIVSKEMYSLLDRNGNELCLRPEGTAGIVRAVLSHKLTNLTPLRYSYAGPMFRYERPQKGRQRQFWQIGVEHLGDSSPLADAESIALAAETLKTLGIINTTLEINTLGDKESRARYRDVLVNFLQSHKNRLSEDSLIRLEKNPLRILDSKSPADQAVLENAPHLSDFLTSESKAFFEDVLSALQNLGISYEINPYLVRGLDYYSHTAFEFRTTELGAKSTVLAGGRYDDLSSCLGGPALPGIGWAAGVERMILLMTSNPTPPPPFMVIPIGSECVPSALKLVHLLRQNHYPAELSYKSQISAGLKRANKLQSPLAFLIGGDEVAHNMVTLRNLITGDQQKVSQDTVLKYLESHQ